MLCSSRILLLTSSTEPSKCVLGLSRRAKILSEKGSVCVWKIGMAVCDGLVDMLIGGKVGGGVGSRTADTAEGGD